MDTIELREELKELFNGATVVNGGELINKLVNTLKEETSRANGKTIEKLPLSTFIKLSFPTHNLLKYDGEPILTILNQIEDREGLKSNEIPSISFRLIRIDISKDIKLKYV